MQVAMSDGWLPGPATFDVSVVSIGELAGYHRELWRGATSGRFRIDAVSGAQHQDLMGHRSRRTGRTIARWVESAER